MAYNKKPIIRLKENLPKVKVNLPQTQTLTRTFSCYTEQLWAGGAVGVGYPRGYTGICGPPARRDPVPSAVAKGEAWPSSFLALPQVGQGGRMLVPTGGARLAGAPWWWALSPPQEALGRAPVGSKEACGTPEELGGSWAQHRVDPGRRVKPRLRRARGFRPHRSPEGKGGPATSAPSSGTSSGHAGDGTSPGTSQRRAAA